MQTEQNKNLWKETLETINWQPGLGMGPRVAQTEKNLPAMQRPGFDPWLGRFPGGHGNPLQYSCLENPHGQRSLAGFMGS